MDRNLAKADRFAQSQADLETIVEDLVADNPVLRDAVPGLKRHNGGSAVGKAPRIRHTSSSHCRRAPL